MHTYSDLITKANESLKRAFEFYALAQRAAERGSQVMSAMQERYAEAAASAAQNYFMMADVHNWANRG